MSILGKVLASTADTLVYTCPANRRAVATLNIANINTVAQEIRTTISIREATDLQVASLTIIDGGNNYNTVPNLAIENATGDVPVQASASVVSMEVKSFDLVNGSIGYNVGDVLSADDAINKQNGDTNLEITVDTVDVDGVITGFTINDGGRYQDVIGSGDNVTFTGGDGTGAAIDQSTLLYGIKEVQVDEPGDDYLVTPTVSVSIGNASIVAAMTSDDVSKYDAIDYNVPIPLEGTLERSPIVLGAGDALYVKSDTLDSLNVIVFGVEEIA